MKLSDILREEISNRSETFSDIANGSGLPLPVVTRFYHGERSLSLASAERLIDYLGIKIAAPSIKQK